MRKLILLILVVSTTTGVFAQRQEKINLNLTNALVIGQMDKTEDRYSLEINTTELMNAYGVKAIPSLNVMKLGGDALVLASDSISKLMQAKNIDTYVLVSVRGFDRKFKVSGLKDNLETALGLSSLFGLYRADIVSISFEFKFFRGGKLIYSDMVKCGNIGDRDTVIKRFRKKVEKRIVKKWKKQ
ncbi:MAG: hypothetical protein P8N52_04850 [Crocinitomicaceae bacterium]|nr:hypothetical protein [Crocinitomicaceae bacterium]MDG1777167.1 hypothetical protein [Crocinitomicaceae bacterium]